MVKGKGRGKRQKQLFFAVALVVVLLFCIFVFSMFNGGSTSHSVQDKRIDLPSDNKELQDAWMLQVQAESRQTAKQVESLSQVVTELTRQKENKEKANKDLQVEVSMLRNELRQKKAEIAVPNTVQNGSVIKSNTDALDPFSQNKPLKNEMGGVGRIREFEIIKAKASGKKRVQNVETTIPAGTTVKALLVSSTDAPCGVMASSNPQPVKLRFLDDAHLPHAVRVKLKGGLLIGSAYGDLSSERVFIRLERLTQTKPSGDFVETQVAGFVSGEDGKFGVRGVVVDRSSELVKSAAYSGFFSGISQYFSTTINAQSIAQATEGLPNDIQWDVLKQGGVSGTTGALGKLSDYFLKRAEQLLPVIQVSSGRVVDVTFTFGVDIGDIHVHDKIETVREKQQQSLSVNLGVSG